MGIIGDYKSFNKNEEKAGLYGNGSVPKSHVNAVCLPFPAPKGLYGNGSVPKSHVNAVCLPFPAPKCLYGNGSVPKSHVSGNRAGRELLNSFINGGTIFDSDVSDKTAPKALAKIGKTIVLSDKLNWFQHSGFDKK
jgi:hypothetical protein